MVNWILVFPTMLDALEDYFEWCDMSDIEDVRFTTLNLVRSTRKYWQLIQQNLRASKRSTYHTMGAYE